MPFTTHLQALNSIHDALASLQQPTQIQHLVCEATGHIIQNCTLFNGCICMTSPFMREFCESIKDEKANLLDEDKTFQLFECLVIFFREKRLRMGVQKLAATERAVLAYFENSNEWSLQEPTLINEWYWHTLPKKVVEESFAQSQDTIN